MVLLKQCGAQLDCKSAQWITYVQPLAALANLILLRLLRTPVARHLKAARVSRGGGVIRKWYSSAVHGEQRVHGVRGTSAPRAAHAKLVQCFWLAETAHLGSVEVVDAAGDRSVEHFAQLGLQVSRGRFVFYTLIRYRQHCLLFSDAAEFVELGACLVKLLSKALCRVTCANHTRQALTPC